MNKFKKILLYGILVIIFICVGDWAIGIFMEHYYGTMKSGVQKNIDYVIRNCNEDIMILGSSRALHHYNPEIISKSCNMSCYNAGLGVQSMLYFRAQELSILKRYNPKVFIIDLIPYSMRYIKGINSPYDKLNCLFPYYGKIPEINSIIELKSNFEKIKLVSSTYKYNSFIYDIIKNNILPPRDIKGYYKIDASMPENLKNEIMIENSKSYSKEKNKDYFYDCLDSNMTKFLNNIIEDCKKNKILFIISYSPIFKNFKKPDFDFENLIDYINNLKTKYDNIITLNYLDDKRFLYHSDLFKDNIHLNTKGSMLFSEIFAKDLKNILDEQKN